MEIIALLLLTTGLISTSLIKDKEMRDCFLSIFGIIFLFGGLLILGIM